MKTFTLLFLIFSVFFAGCGRVSENAINDILEKDPSFKKTLDAKKRISSKILSLKQEMEPKIHALMAKLEEIRSEYGAGAKDLKNSLSRLKNMRKLLAKKSELSLSGDEISIWNKRVNNLEKEIASLRKGLDKLRSKIRVLKTEIKILKQ